VLLAGVVLALAALATPALAADESSHPPAADKSLLPVPYGMAAAITGELAGPGSDPPGSNDWSCRPSAAHPEPVVLVHGLLGSKTTNWQTVSPLLSNSGYCVFALTYGVRAPGVFPQDQIGGLLPMEQSARELDAFVTRVLAATGASRVDLVGHSEGTIMPEYWLQFLGGAARTDHYVAVTPLYQGTLAQPLPTAALADALGVREPASAMVGLVCGSCPQFVAGSPYVRRMNAQPGGPAVPGVTYTTIMTSYDELVVPYTSGRLEAPNATNIVVQDGCAIDRSDHVSIISTARTGQLIRNALDPAHASPPPCHPALPALGNQVLPR
jgi:triacylglycerol esterase/lipase EstA (alpha/beta hydrolase family)